eukprot:9783391-Heterocapsa_arctica.AAC.1
MGASGRAAVRRARACSFLSWERDRATRQPRRADARSAQAAACSAKAKNNPGMQSGQANRSYVD